VLLTPGGNARFNTAIQGGNDLITAAESSNVQGGCVLHTDP